MKKMDTELSTQLYCHHLQAKILKKTQKMSYIHNTVKKYIQLPLYITIYMFLKYFNLKKTLCS